MAFGIEAAVGTALGAATAKWEDRRAIDQARQLQGYQLAGQKEMGKFNQAMAIDTWNKTGMKAQRKQMEDAGLNVGLMYKGSGPGGTTSAPGTGSMPTPGASPAASQGLGMGMQAAMQAESLRLQKRIAEADIANTEADTQLKKANTPGEGQTQAKLGEEIQGLKITNANKAIEGDIMNYQKKMAEIEAGIKEKTAEFSIQMAWDAAIELAGKAKSAQAKGTFDEKALPELEQQVKLTTTEQSFRIALQKADLKLTEEQTKQVKMATQHLAKEISNMTQENMREWDKMAQKDKEIFIQQKLADLAKQNTEFNTGAMAQIGQLTQVLTGALDVITKAGGMGGGARKIGF